MPNDFLEQAERVGLKPAQARELFVAALTSLTLTPELALAMPGGRAVVRAEYELGLRSSAEGAVLYPPSSYKDAELQKALDARYPVPTKRVRNTFITAFGECWYERDLWMTRAEKEESGHPMAVAACAAIGGADVDYPTVLAPRDAPPELVVPIDDSRDAIE